MGFVLFAEGLLALVRAERSRRGLRNSVYGTVIPAASTSVKHSTSKCDTFDFQQDSITDYNGKLWLGLGYEASTHHAAWNDTDIPVQVLFS